MIGLGAIWVLGLGAVHAPEESARSLLRQAAKQLRAVGPYATDASASNLDDAKNSFRKVLHLYGEIPAARAGLARCLLYEGLYREAQADFKLAGPAYAGNARQAEALDHRASAISRALHGTQVLELRPVPESNLCVALTGVRGGPDDWDGRMDFDVRIVVASIARNGSAKIIDRQQFRLTHRMGGVGDYADPKENEDAGAASAELYLMRRSKNSRAWSAVVRRNYSAADCEPAAVEIADVTAAGLRRVSSFGSLQGVSAYPSDERHGLTVVVAPTFKVWWTDVYEWRNGRFVFANARHPGFYSQADYGWTDEESEYYYPMWMNRAAIYDIQRRWGKALYMWKRAERSCGKTIRTAHDPDREYRDVGFYGQAKINLVEIRKRIAWLKKREYNHPLLYRPYDFDVQIPPYRFGRATGVQYGP